MIKGHVVNTTNVSCNFPAPFAHCEKHESMILKAQPLRQNTKHWLKKEEKNGSKKGKKNKKRRQKEKKKALFGCS